MPVRLGGRHIGAPYDPAAGGDAEDDSKIADCDTGNHQCACTRGHRGYLDEWQFSTGTGELAPGIDVKMAYAPKLVEPDDIQSIADCRGVQRIEPDRERPRF